MSNIFAGPLSAYGESIPKSTLYRIKRNWDIVSFATSKMSARFRAAGLGKLFFSRLHGYRDRFSIGKFDFIPCP